MNELLTIREVTKILKVSRATLYLWFASGKLRAFKVGRGVRIKKEDLAQLMVTWKKGKGKPPKKEARKKGRKK